MARKHELTGMETIVTAAVGLAIGLVIGAFLLGRGVGTDGYVTAIDSTTMTRGAVDAQVVATYKQGGKTVEVTASEVYDYLGVDANSDGSYRVLTASELLQYIRVQVMSAEATSRGIEVSDDTIDNYAENEIGGTVSELATTYGVSEDVMREQIRLAEVEAELTKQVLGEEKYADYTAETIAAPTSPEVGEDGTVDGSVTSKEYADYIIGLVGDEWDSENGKFVEGSKFIELLADYKMSAESASYDAAYAVYTHLMDASYQRYLAAYQEWTNYLNSLFASVAISLSTIAA